MDSNDPAVRAAGITLIKPNARQQPGQANSMMLQTIDIDRLDERLRESGLQRSDISQASWGRFANFHGPQGYGWVVAEPSLDI